MITLQLPPGAAEYPIAHDTVSYVPYRADHADPASVWLIDVPDHVAVHLMHVGGFSMAKKERPALAVRNDDVEWVRMRHPESVGCSFAGRVHEPDTDGIVRVPAAAVAELLAHGFVAVEDPPAE